MLQKNVDGIIIEPVKLTLPNPNTDLYRQLRKNGIPLVFINCWYAEIEKPVCVAMNNKQGGRLCAQYLVQNGHRQIAAMFKANDQESVARYASLAEYLTKAKLPMADNNILWYTVFLEEASLETKVLKTIEGCTAIVCFNNQIAFQVIKVLRKLGKNIPRDMAVIAFDNSVFSETSPVKITALAHAQEELGVQSAKKLIHLIKGEPQTSTLVPWKIVEKEST